jgi:hypothetical protein
MAIDYEKVLQQYFGNVNARNAEGVISMYAPAGELVLHTGQRIAGRAQLLEFFSTMFQQAPPAPRVVNIIGGERQCAAELLVILPGDVERRVADIFQFNANGLIDRLAIYATETAAT